MKLRNPSEFIMILCTVLARSTCFHYGPPATDHVCQNMFPEGHHVDAQVTDDPPYEIVLSQNVYTRWEDVQVSLKAKPGHYFRGFFLQARRANCSHSYKHVPVGTFTVLPGDQRLLKTLPCFNNKDSAISHRINESLSKAVFRWNAPAALIGPLFFVATVVQEQEIFWTNVKYLFMRDLSQKELKGEFCPTKSYIDPPHIITTLNPMTTAKFRETTTCGVTSVNSCLLSLSFPMFASIVIAYHFVIQ